jgi:hypothetical protein
MYKSAGFTKVEDDLYFISSFLYNLTTNKTLPVELSACVVKVAFLSHAKGGHEWTKVSTMLLLNELTPVTSILKRHSLRGR